MISTCKSHVMFMENGENSWQARIQQELEKFKFRGGLEQLKKTSIYHLQEFSKPMESPTPSTPQVVSFGPYHHGEQNLMLVEGYKQRALVHFLLKSERPLSHFVRAMQEVMEELQAQYDMLEDKWQDKAEFMKLMITDGCFMLELLRFFRDYCSPYYHSILSYPGTQRLLRYIRQDMLKLENQLPLLVVKVLVHASMEDQPDSPVVCFNLIKYLG
ncbi:hypothetical protein DsansV1_C08g0083231 [Dioscorea sansibarensis]